MFDRVADIATAVVAIATVIYSVFSVLLWRATKRLAELTKDSVEHSRLVFQAAHRPFIGVAIELEPYQNTDDWLLLTCTVKNVGSDQALGVEIECKAGLDLFHGIYQFGDLQPSEARSVGDRFSLGGALAKAWIAELDGAPPLRFQYSRQFRDSSGQAFKEVGELRYDPSDAVRGRIHLRAAKP